MTAMDNAPRPRDLLRALFAKVDAFFARPCAEHGDAITCHAGCHDCCRRSFSVTSIEADAIREALERMPAPRRREIAEPFAMLHRSLAIEEEPLG